MSGIEQEGVGPAFRNWRAHRPFVGGLLLTLGGVEILVTMKVSLKIVVHLGMQGLAGFMLPALMVVVGLLILFNPTQRLFYSIVGIMLTLGTWVTSNLGGFFVGLALGAVGSCMAFGWLPDQEPRVSRRQRREDKKQGKAAMDSTEAPATDDGQGDGEGSLRGSIRSSTAVSPSHLTT
ncbi:DUF6114 domain-containing protein [Streptomyces turgidiscabies]|uniref:DUF6114 domain-containing protein n=1 Tax=Streptomyces TaxID=1883 RepID=UPI00076E947D|nr:MULTISPECIES: DUF6114 domain-containing protein [Streptomyces]MDX3495094.1 DUF6114 domain-containing protein [Streptomyces turgidiscabies]GAQ70967.1 hypothetical protein T45_02709 [Streptomyces turgidiscabies]